MNILQDINTNNLLFRPFFVPAKKSSLSEFTPFFTKKGIKEASDPKFNQYEPFKYGYGFDFFINFEKGIEKIKDICESNLMIEILAPASGQNLFYRIGDQYGFKIIEFEQLFKLTCPDQYTLRLKTVRPVKQPYEILDYTHFTEI